MTEEEKLQKALKAIRAELTSDHKNAVEASLKIIDEAIGTTPKDMLTGKAIHAAFVSHNSEAQSWESLSLKGQAAYDAVATRLNEQFLAPLQGLARALYQGLDENEVWEEIKDVYVERIQERFKLLVEESKSCN